MFLFPHSATLDGFEYRQFFLSSLWRVGKPYSLAHDWLIVQQVSERNSVQYIVDLLLKKNPHRTNAAEVRSGAAIGLHRVAHAMEIERLELRRLNHFADRGLSGRLCKRIPATCASSARDDARSPQTKENLLHVIGGKLLALRDVAAVYGTLTRAPREMKRADHAILRPGRYPHEFKIDGSLSGDNEIDLPRRNAAVLPAGNTNLGHLPEIEHFVDFIVWNHVLALHEVANQYVLLH